jgi:predicted chitinase
MLPRSGIRRPRRPALGWLMALLAGCVISGAVVVAPPAVAAPVVADRAAVVRVAAGHLTWLVRTSPGGGNAQVSFAYGVAGDIPVWGDWNNDGTKTPGVFRNGAWLLKNSLSGGSADVQIAYGRAGDVPVVGDWDGVGGVGLGVVRGTAWLLRQSVTPGVAQIQFAYGTATDVPVVGDWNGNGSDTPGVFRNGAWLLKNSLAGGSADVQVAYGRAGDLPMVGNWDGAGGIGLGVYRGHGQWLLRDSVSGGDATTAFAYGTPTDTPVYTTYLTSASANDGLTMDQLRAIYPSTPGSMSDALPSLNHAMAAASINNPRRRAAFVANLIVESSMRYDALEPITSTCANYNGGCTYRGRGFIQLTHRYNYEAAAGALNADLAGNPELARSAAYSPRIAVWFWDERNLNNPADALNIGAITVAINGAGASAATRQARCDHFRAGMRVLTGSVPAGITC